MSFDGEMVVHYDDVPGSVNSGAGGHRRHWSKGAGEKDMWEGIFQVLFMQAKLPRRLAYIEASAELQFVRAGRTRRDPENFRHPITKPFGDALVKGGWLHDDNPDYYEFTTLTISREKLTGVGPLVKSRMVLTIKYRLSRDAAGPLSAGGADPGRAASAGAPLGDPARG